MQRVYELDDVCIVEVINTITHTVMSLVII